MGPIGMQEMVFIFLLALVLFGPKKLPELARTLGKAINQFRQAQSEMKATFDRELRNLELETKGHTGEYQAPSYNYDYSSPEPEAYETYESHVESADTETSTYGASVTEGADPKPAQLPEGTIAHAEPTAVVPVAHEEPEHEPAASGAPAEHKA